MEVLPCRTSSDHRLGLRERRHEKPNFAAIITEYNIRIH